MKKLLYLAILVSPLIFFTNVTRNPYVIQGTVLYVSLLSILIIFLFNSLKTGKITFYGTPLDIPILIFCAVCLFSWLRAFTFNGEISGFGKIPGYFIAVWSEGLRNNLYIIINCVLAYYISANLVRDEKTIKRVLFFSYLVAFISGIYAVMQYFDIEPIWEQVINPYGIKRCVSTFGNPVFLSSFLVIMIPLSIASLINTKSGMEKFFYILLTAVMLAALFCTMARSSWMGMIVSMIVLIVAFREKIKYLKKWIYLLFFILFLAMLIPARWEGKTRPFGYYVTDRLTSIFSIDKSGPAAYQRFLIWLSAWDMAEQNPVLGKGWGLFEMYFPFYQRRYLIEKKIAFRTHANNAHNVFLENLSQIGIVGFGIFLWLMTCVVMFGMHQIRHISDNFKKTLAVGIFAGTCGILVDNILNVSLYFVIPGFFFWINLGIFSVLAESNKKIINHNLFSKIAAVFLILLSFSGIIHYTRIFIAEKDYFTGFNLVKNPNIPLESSVVYLERAHKNRRLEVNTNYELANTYARISAQYRYAGNMEKAEDFQKKAIWAYKESLAANPGYDEIYFNLATIQSQRREFDSALENYKRAVFINPHSSDGLSTLGNLYLSKGELFAARNAFRQSLHINPLNKDIWNNLGYVNMKLGFKDEARDAYQKALEIDPNFDMARKNLFNLPR